MDHLTVGQRECVLALRFGEADQADRAQQVALEVALRRTLTGCRGSNPSSEAGHSGTADRRPDSRYGRRRWRDQLEVPRILGRPFEAVVVEGRSQVEEHAVRSRHGEPILPQHDVVRTDVAVDARGDPCRAAHPDSLGQRHLDRGREASIAAHRAPRRGPGEMAVGELKVGGHHPGVERVGMIGGPHDVGRQRQQDPRRAGRARSWRRTSRGRRVGGWRPRRAGAGGARAGLDDPSHPSWVSPDPSGGSSSDGKANFLSTLKGKWLRRRGGVRSGGRALRRRWGRRRGAGCRGRRPRRAGRRRCRRAGAW